MVARRYFTLLELMIGISLMMIAGSLVGVNLHKSIEKKKFTSSLARLKTRLLDCRQLAINMQADWQGDLRLSNGEWIFDAYTLDEAKFPNFRPLKLEKFDLFWNGKKVAAISFLFASGGEVRIDKQTSGTIAFSKKNFQDLWQFPTLFQLDESGDEKKAGPLHPDELP